RGDRAPAAMASLTLDVFRPRHTQMIMRTICNRLRTIVNRVAMGVPGNGVADGKVTNLQKWMQEYLPICCATWYMSPIAACEAGGRARRGYIQGLQPAGRGGPPHRRGWWWLWVVVSSSFFLFFVSSFFFFPASRLVVFLLRPSAHEQ